MKLKAGSVVITSIKNSTEIEFAKIQQLFVHQSKIIIGLQAMNIVEYSSHYHSWIVEPLHARLLLYTTDLPSRQILTPRPVRVRHWKHFFITLKYAV